MVELSEISNQVALTEEEIHKVVENFQLVFRQEINLGTIVTAVTELMKIVGKFSKLKGEEKKYIVTQILLYVIDSTDSGSYDDILDSVLKAVIPVMIDTLISVENGQIVFNLKERCFPCF